jgi:hypothetical protein
MVKQSPVSLFTLLLATICLSALLSWVYIHNVNYGSWATNDFRTHSSSGNKLLRTEATMALEELGTSSALTTEIATATTNIKGPRPHISMTTKVVARVPVLHTVTYASHGGRDDRFCRAVESAVQHKYDLVILGWKLPWKGLSQKLEAAHSYASSLPPDDLLLFTDAFDVLFTNTPNHIVEQFMKTNATLLFSAECGCWPHIIENKGKACFEDYPPAPVGSPYRYLNSGTWIGRASAAKAMLEEVIREAGNDFANANDQKLVADMFISGRFGIALDYYNAIFQSMHMTLDPPLPRCNPAEDMQAEQQPQQAGGGTRWYNKRTKGTPALLHFNGGGKRHHLAYEAKSWYKQPQYIQQQQQQQGVDRTHSPVGNYLLSVPTATATGGKLKFNELCGDYLRHG